MFISYETFSALIGLLTVLILVILVRRSRLHPFYLGWWFGTICVLLIFSLNPRLINKLGELLDIAYPPIIIAVVGLLSILIKILSMDIYITQSEIRYKKLAQKMAVLEREMQELKESLKNPDIL